MKAIDNKAIGKQKKTLNQRAEKRTDIGREEQTADD